MKKKGSLKKTTLRTIKLLTQYIRLPHIITLLVIIIGAIIMCSLSIVYYEENTLLSSLCGNIFAGLVTGIIICLISTIKAVCLYRTECLVEWLNGIHEDCMKFLEMYHKIAYESNEKFKDKNDFYTFVYDTVCCGHEVTVKISQGRFDKTLPFNTYKYCKKEFDFDADEITKCNEKLRDDIYGLDVEIYSKSKKEIQKMFEDMNTQIQNLNKSVLSKIRELNAKKKAIYLSIG